MYSAYVGLGANLGDPAAQLRSALDAIAALDGTRIVATSRFYRSAPMGPPDQPEYCNAVCQVQTALTPRDLLDALIGIERTAGRIRGGERWGPRRLDLDLLHVEGIAMDEPGLHLPHPGIASRNFVLVPLAELAPQLQIPALEPIETLVRAVGMEGLSAWDAIDAPPA
jgi:2-amino-4-hydroxy-6-hydroxymethyldihydropteridine diphosphokinase